MGIILEINCRWFITLPKPREFSLGCISVKLYPWWISMIICDKVYIGVQHRWCGGVNRFLAQLWIRMNIIVQSKNSDFTKIYSGSSPSVVEIISASVGNKTNWKIPKRPVSMRWIINRDQWNLDCGLGLMALSSEYTSVWKLIGCVRNDLKG